MVTSVKVATDCRLPLHAAVIASLLLTGIGCRRTPATASQPRRTTLKIGFGLTSGLGPQFGIRQVVRNMSLEGLVNFQSDGRPRPWLADSWSTSTDGLIWRLKLRPDVTFHDGKPVTASAVREILLKNLPQTLGPAFADIEEIHVVSDREIEFSLKQPSAFLAEGLDVSIQDTGAQPTGTGPFYESGQTGDQVEMRANEKYYAGRPLIDSIVIKPYGSVRSAWADMLRGEVDVLYEVGVDALDSLQPSNDVKVFSYRRRYAYMVLLNVTRPSLRDRSIRRAMNAAINRQALVAEVFQGHATPADGPIWPSHWARSPKQPTGSHIEKAVVAGPQRIHLKCLFADSSLERLALAIQQHLRAIGVDLDLELASGEQWFARAQAGDFDTLLGDFIQGPNLVRPYLFWHSSGPINYGHFTDRDVDAALDSIRHAANDDAYRAGVGAFQRAIEDDPPAIFLAWGEGARAISTRFDVPVEAGRDVLSLLRLWKPVVDNGRASHN